LYIQYSGARGVGSASPTIWIAVVGGTLVVASLVSFSGMRISFALGAVLSAAVLAIVALQWGDFATSDAEAAVILSVVSIALDALASRPAKALSERDSPLNLPVFG